MRDLLIRELKATGRHSDITVICNGKEYKLHSPLLALTSEFFDKEVDRRAKRVEVECPGGHEVFEEIVTHCYECAEAVDVREDNAMPLLHAAARFKLDLDEGSLASKCCQFALSKSRENVSFAHQFLEAENRVRTEFPVELTAAYADAINGCVADLIRMIAIECRRIVDEHRLTELTLLQPRKFAVRAFLRAAKSRRDEESAGDEAGHYCSKTMDELRGHEFHFQPAIGPNSSLRIQRVVEIMPKLQNLGSLRLDVNWILSCLVWAFESKAAKERCRDVIIDWVLLAARRVMPGHFVLNGAQMQISLVTKIMKRADNNCTEETKVSYSRLGAAALPWLGTTVEIGIREGKELLAVSQMERIVRLIARLGSDNTPLIETCQYNPINTPKYTK
eukprot:m.37387 g.37387  ORF g.37387 m.37387 type:complete len:391 (+) comp32373_c0_seq1:72-1244(+)